jgi:hypothetical protein
LRLDCGRGRRKRNATLSSARKSAPDGQKKNTSEKKKPEGARPQAGIVQKLLKKVEQRLSKDDVKASLGDYIRLVQLQKELEDEEQPREMKVTWVEAEKEESDSEK